MKRDVKITAVYSPDSIRKFARGTALTCNRGKRNVQKVIESIFSQFCDDSIFERSRLVKHVAIDRERVYSVRFSRMSGARSVLAYPILFTLRLSLFSVIKENGVRHLNAARSQDPAST